MSKFLDAMGKNLLKLRKESVSTEGKHKRRIERIQNKGEREKEQAIYRNARMKRQKEESEARTALAKARRAEQQAKKELWDVRYQKIGSALAPVRKVLVKGGKAVVREGKKQLKEKPKKKPQKK